jgi:hypothetical protein
VANVLKTGDRVRTPAAGIEGAPGMEIQGDTGIVVQIELLDDGRRVAHIEHDDDSPANPGGHSIVNVEQLERID